MSLMNVDMGSRWGVQLVELRLSDTYAGLLEGLPNAEVNDRIVDAAVRAARSERPDRPVHLVEPVRVRPDVDQGRMRSPVEELPRVLCVGTFEDEGIGPDADPVWTRSWLTVVWFQREASLDGIGDVVSGLAWTELARDVDL